jgi:hypothetical protein
VIVGNVTIVLLLRPRLKAALYALTTFLFVSACAATTVILVVTQSGMLIGVDGKINTVCTDATAPCIDQGDPLRKAFLVQKRFAVAAIGLQRADILAADGKPLFVYDFQTWLEQIEDRLPLNATLSELNWIVKDEYKKPLAGLELAIRDRIVAHEDPNLIPRYIVVGYETGVANAYSIKADLDWEHHVVRTPVVSHLFPARGERVDYGLRILGHQSALNDFCDPATSVNRRISQRFHKLSRFCSGHDLSLLEARNLIVELLNVQAEHDRAGDTPPYRVITIKKPETRRSEVNSQ